MITVNRTAIVVTPGQPFLDWLQSIDPTSADLTLEDMRQDASVYLSPECDTDEEVRKRLRRVCGRMFEEQLENWWREPSSWPVQRDLATFEHWFEYTVHSLVVDLSTGSLSREKL